MGLTSSSNALPPNPTEEFKRLQQRLQKDLKTHRDAVGAMHHSVDAHCISIDILTPKMRDKKNQQQTSIADFLDVTKNALKCESETLSGTLNNLSLSLNDILCENVLQTLSSSTVKMNNLEEENKNLKRDLEQQKRNATRSESSLRTVEQNFYDRERRCREYERELQKTKSENNELKSNLEWIRSQNEEKKRTINDLNYQVSDLQRQIFHLEQAKRIQKVTIPVQLYCDRKDDLMTRVMSELMSMLATQMSTDNVDLACTRCERREDIHRDKLLLVLCINASRIGTDASNAIAGIPQPDKTALLVLHHKNIHALPNQSSDRMLTTSEFKALAGIFDMAFLADKGIYTCDMNNLAISGILHFVKTSMGRSN